MGQFVPIAAYPAPSVDGGLGAWLSAPLALSADEAREFPPLEPKSHRIIVS